MLGVNTCTSKKDWANNGVKNINRKEQLIVDGVEPKFHNHKKSTIDKKPRIDCSKTLILSLIEKKAAKDDYILENLKKYYKMEKQFFRKYRDHKDYQIGYITDSGTYTRGRLGRTPHNL